MPLINRIRLNTPGRATTILYLCFFLLAACTTRQENALYKPLNNISYLPNPDITATIPGLSNCTHADDTKLHLNSSEPVTIIVHGCFSSAGRFRSLAEALAFHRQQVICFNYNDRDSLTKSSGELVASIEALSGLLQQPTITLIGHSQGGLIAHRALIKERPDRLKVNNAQIDLITVSTPFGGVEMASACGSTTWAWLSLGLIKPICYIAAGTKYKEITPNSEFIRKPGRLVPAVKRHLRIITDETDTCRHYDEHGSCIEDDYVLSIAEQTHRRVDEDIRILPVLIKSGHVEIMGSASKAPRKLIGILEQQGFIDIPERNLARQSETDGNNLQITYSRR